jgi:D-3-phosphoglycerate dehydrogenase
MQRRVLVTEPVHEEALSLLRDAGWQVLGPGAPFAPADALLVRTRKLTADEVGQFGMISKHGVGVDNIPLEAARQAGVAVMNTPGANASAVAEQTLMLMLALARDLDGQRTASSPPSIVGLEGRRLLVIGFGASGRKVAALGQAFGLSVTVYSRSLHAARHAGFAIATNLKDALKRHDIITLHCPLTDDTRYIIGAEELALLPGGALLINCARGGLVDETALIKALTSGRLGGAALDVTEVEPLPKDHALRSIPRLILTPHAAAQSAGATRRMGMMAAQNILDHFAGKPDPAHIVVEKA